MHIIMNDELFGSSVFSRHVIAVFPKTIKDVDPNNTERTLNFHDIIKYATINTIEHPDDIDIENSVYMDPEDNSNDLLPKLFHNCCILIENYNKEENDTEAINLYYSLHPATFDHESIKNSEVFKNMLDSYDSKDLTLPYVLFLQNEDLNMIREANESNKDVCTVIVSRFTINNKSEDDVDFYVSTINLTVLFEEMEIEADSDFIDNDENDMLLICNPCYFVPANNEVFSEYTEEAFVTSVYIQDDSINTHDVIE